MQHEVRSRFRERIELDGPALFRVNPDPMGNGKVVRGGGGGGRHQGKEGNRDQGKVEEDYERRERDINGQREQSVRRKGVCWAGDIF